MTLTVTGLWPIGVPGFEFLLLELPQLANRKARAKAQITRESLAARFLRSNPARKQNPGTMKKPKYQFLVLPSAKALEGAVVNIWRVALAPLMLAALQVDSAGRPAQETEKLELEKFEKVKIVDPLAPGDEIVIVVGFAETEGGWGGETVRVAKPD